MALQEEQTGCKFGNYLWFISSRNSLRAKLIDIH
jgi:hypothetical protein